MPFFYKKTEAWGGGLKNCIVHAIGDIVHSDKY